jgi:hypothetical protein
VFEFGAILFLVLLNEDSTIIGPISHRTIDVDVGWNFNPYMRFGIYRWWIFDVVSVVDVQRFEIDQNVHYDTLGKIK